MNYIKITDLQFWKKSPILQLKILLRQKCRFPSTKKPFKFACLKGFFCGIGNLRQTCLI